jgi:bis(5'-nucleosyl)-tetraphosphatase (symmetrical)
MTLYVLGDVQGCASALDALLAKLRLRKTDHLWLVGDLVNRGPDSVGVLRRVIALGDRATCVLGNHDLHLLAAAAGARDPSATDTFQDVLGAHDAGTLLKWLRCRPLLHLDRSRRLVLVHAGIPPIWRVREAAEHAAEIEQILRGSDWKELLRGMYGSTPLQWSDDLADDDRRRFTINALTRMRYWDPRGKLDLDCSSPPGTQPPGLVPWFDARKPRRKWHIVFGHWSALGLVRREDVTAVDTGCVWGGALTAVALDPAGAAVQAACTQNAVAALKQRRL